MTNKSPAPRLDLALIAHELSERLVNLFAEYDARLVLCRERSTCTLQVQFDGEAKEAMTLVTAAKMGNYRFVGIGESRPDEERLPDWLDPVVWREWIDYRKEIGKPLTNRSRKAQLALLESQFRMGLDHRASIRESIRNGWVGLFPAKAERRHRGQQANAEFARGDR